MTTQPRVLLIGDSITQEAFFPHGWGAGLANWYIRRADVINRGFDGWNTRWILRNRQRIAASLGHTTDGIITKQQPYVLGTLLLGANDNATTYQNVPLEEYEQNLLALARWMRDGLGIPHLLIMGPPPFHAGRFATDRSLAVDDVPRSDERHAAYGEAARRVAAEMGAAFLSLRDAIRAAMPGDRWGEALHDGLHLSDEGNTVALAAIKEAIATQLPECQPSALNSHLLPLFEAMEQYPDGELPAELLK